MNLLGFLHTEKPKKNFFEQPNNQKLKNKKLNKSHFQGFANSQYFSVKISGIGSWMCRIDWYEGHWCGSTYMALHQSWPSNKVIIEDFTIYAWSTIWHCTVIRNPRWTSETSVLSICQFSIFKFFFWLKFILRYHLFKG